MLSQFCALPFLQASTHSMQRPYQMEWGLWGKSEWETEGIILATLAGFSISRHKPKILRSGRLYIGILQALNMPNPQKTDSRLCRLLENLHVRVWGSGASRLEAALQPS